MIRQFRRRATVAELETRLAMAEDLGDRLLTAWQSATADVERAQAQIQAVRRLHTADEFSTVCLHCQVRWPCQTIRDLNEATR